MKSIKVIFDKEIFRGDIFVREYGGCPYIVDENLNLIAAKKINVEDFKVNNEFLKISHYIFGEFESSGYEKTENNKYTIISINK
jgi:hypothetical protein